MPEIPQNRALSINQTVTGPFGWKEWRREGDSNPRYPIGYTD